MGSKITAAVLSGIVPGLGQIYNGELWKGIGIHLLMWASLGAMFLVLGFFTTPVIWGIAVADAYVNAEKRV
jgi:TM2 domain-containing membrane protein YozV